jgi:hypothetical protein
MCSTPAQRIAEIGKAIDDLAAEARLSSANRGIAVAATAEAATGVAAAEHTDGVVLRIAKLWQELAELDPEVAKRLPTYQV